MTIAKKAKRAKKKQRTDKRREWYDEQRAAGKDVRIIDAIVAFNELGLGRSKNTIRKWVRDEPSLKNCNGLILYADEPDPESDENQAEN